MSRQQKTGGTLRRRRGWKSGFVLVLIAAVSVPAAVSGLSMPETVRIKPLEDRPAPPAARFSHWSHNQYHCYSCHPSVFPKKNKGFTHEEMEAGKFCGACHDGKRSWSLSDADCGLCHVED
jgi:c(7)-type cytochrome triheme protein